MPNKALLTDLQRLLRTLEADLLERGESHDLPEVGRALHADYDQAREAGRTAQSYEEWRGDYITQMAAAWVLSGVFARFLEDNRLIDPPKLSGPGERLGRARDEHELFFRSNPKLNDRDYLLAVFKQLAALPGGKEVFGSHNPIHELPNWLSGDAAGEMLAFFQRIDPDSGHLAHDFTDPEWDTRFLGDLYQDLSEAARKKYALLQTPEFVEEFILDRTLEPAIAEFGLEINHETHEAHEKEKKAGDKPRFRMIDPACGSGHFLLGAFRRLLNHWRRREPGTNSRVLVQRALDSVHGVDVNPYAVAIARFRLLLAAMGESAVARLADAPAFTIHVLCGDSLLHGSGEQQSFGWRDVDHATYAEDLAELRRALVPGRYHAVVANPPYITPKDRALNQAYRERYAACHMKYSLSVPFMERIFRLATEGGFTGQITANSFMKREFGKKLIEQFLPTVDLTHVIDTSGAYIPGHGTPTVILFGRHRIRVAGTIRTVMGIRGEPSTPDDPGRGLVWSAIVNQVDTISLSLRTRERVPGAGVRADSEFVSVADSPREQFAKHPWSIGGGGAAELKERLDEVCSGRLGAIVSALGISAVTGEDELFMQPRSALLRSRVELERALVEGDVVRDWSICGAMSSVWMYDQDFNLLPLQTIRHTSQLFWRFRAAIYRRKRFGTPLVERGLTWYEWQELYKDKLRTPLSIVFAFVATHNHFVLDRGGKVFNRSAPVIKLPAEATEDDHLALLGLLNSSTACFWMKQVFHDKGRQGVNEGFKSEEWERFYEHSGTGIQQFPLPSARPLSLARLLDGLAQAQQSWLPASVLSRGVYARQAWDAARQEYHVGREAMIAAQEELDWACYRLYGLIDQDLIDQDALTPALSRREREESPAALTPAPTDAKSEASSTESKTPSNLLLAENANRPLGGIANDATSVLRAQGRETAEGNAANAPAALTPALSRRERENDAIQNPPVALGQRAFEIVMARKMAAGELETTWFKRHGSTPITDVPELWPDDYRRLVERRIEVIETNPQIALIEQPEYKRRWNTIPWEEQAGQALRAWLLDRLEGYFDFDGRMGELPRALTPALSRREREESPPNPLTEIALVSVGRLADVARQDAAFMQVAELYRDDPAFDVLALVAELVVAESVPLLPVLRYKAGGLRKRAEWERVWELQREEDEVADGGTTKHTKHTKKENEEESKVEGEEDRDERTKEEGYGGEQEPSDAVSGAPSTSTSTSTSTTTSTTTSTSTSSSSSSSSFRVFRVFRGSLPPPPKYTSTDFLKSDYWRLRGKLDVPKERWVSFPRCEGPDGTLVIAWAGYDHLQLARAISGYYVDIQERLGGRDDPRLIPLLAGLIELLAWLKQWHNEPDGKFNGMRMGDYFEGFVQEEARQMGKTLDEIKAWQPPAGRSRGREGDRPRRENQPRNTRNTRKNETEN